MSLGGRLGDAATRRRRHVRVALLGAALLVLAAVLVFAVDDDGGSDFAGEATAACDRFSERIDREFALLFPDEPPGEAAVAEYLGRAFADTMDELVATLRELDGGDDADAVLDALDERLAEVRADPVPFATGERLVAEGIAEQFDELGVPACGSEFLDTGS